MHPTARYSLAEEYVAAKAQEADVVWPTKTDDFYPYADEPHSFMTGYFTSRLLMSAARLQAPSKGSRSTREYGRRNTVVRKLPVVARQVPQVSPTGLVEIQSCPKAVQ